ncbi:hypothetical protein [Trinickia sp. Y13]|uniref:phenylacetate--CoA ligase family protein n=1 Tax=Trinickia sp. Y13 TaxID=2917807 RepID=UPI00240508D5|nr:hypothetical protein [Trinickia sp. Y13]MDG0025364.1 hypothetical protein [Trinickia sp. Y13]
MANSEANVVGETVSEADGAHRFETLRVRHAAQARAAVAPALERLRWPADALKRERNARLRALIAHAKRHSPWHARRLAHVDPQAVTDDDLPGLPTMTKHDLMSNFDEIVTDRRLSLALANDHLSTLNEGSRYLLDDYRVVATSGSSGHRGVFVYDWDGWIECYVNVQRYALAYAAAAGMKPGAGQGGYVIAHIAASQSTHMTYALAETFRTPEFQFLQFPVTSPMEDIVQGLNRAQPLVLQGYASMLGLLAREAEQGRLNIKPGLLISIAEPLLPNMRELLLRAFPGISLQNWWATTETSGLGMSCGAGPWLHLSDDTLIVELVDARGVPVQPGQTADKIYVTNLFNKGTPLIRYEISDQPTLLQGPCPCGSAHRRVADLQGRREETFVYENERSRSIAVHPKVFTSVLFSEAGVLDYRITQTREGVIVEFLPGGPVDCDAVAKRIADALAALGLSEPQVVVRPSAALHRGQSGKLIRHVALSGTCA